jgi:hypothetical protein
VAPASDGELQLIMPQQLQVIPLDVFVHGVQNSRRRNRRKTRAALDSTAESPKQAKTQCKPEKVVQPVAALLYQSVVATQQEQAEAKRLQKVKPQQIIQPVTALQFMAALAQQQVAPQRHAAASGDTAQDTAAPQSDPSVRQRDARWERELQENHLAVARQIEEYWARKQHAPASEPTPTWVWCAGFAVVQLLIGCILLLLAINPAMLSYLLALAGALSLFSLCFPASREAPIISLSTIHIILIPIALFTGVRALLS